MIKELLLVTHTSGPGGYEVHSRGVLRELFRTGIKVQLINLPYSRAVVKKDEEMNKIIDVCVNTNVSLTAPIVFLCVPNLIFARRTDGTGPVYGRKNISYTTFEADRICKQWVEIGNLLDLTLVTNSFAKSVWVNSGVKEEKVEVVEEGTDLEEYHPDVEPLPLKNEKGLLADQYKNRFIAVMEHSNRKNLDNLLKTFVKAFEGDKETCLILKISHHTNLATRISQAGCSKANIFAYTTLLPSYTMPNFLAVGTHYFSMSHGEGWDLSCVDMGAMKRTIVIPNHTSYSTYLNDNKAFLIKADKKEPAVQNPPLDTLFAGSQWWIPDVDDAVDKLRESVKTDNIEKKENFYKEIKERYTWRRCAEKLLRVLNERA